MGENVAVSGAERARRASLGLLSLMIVLACAAVLREAGGTAVTVALGVFLVVPLLLPLRGILRRDRRVYAWATLCLTPQFLYALTELVANPPLRGLAATMLVTSLGLTLALVAYLRLTRPTSAH